MKRIVSIVTAQWAILGIVAVGILLRLHNLTKISLWHDEAFSALLIKYSWGEMIYRIGLDVHPPMYYIFLRVWHYVIGYSLFSLRLFSVFFGVATIVMVYVFVKRFFKNNTTALLAALLVAVNPFQVQYVTEARMYTMGAFFAVVAAYLLALALEYTVAIYKDNQAHLKLRMLLAYAGFTLTASILTHTHYYLLFTVAALGIYGACFLFVQFKFQLKRYLLLVLSGLGIGVLFLPWLKVFLFQYKQVGAGYWIPPMDMYSIPSTLYDLLVRIPPGNKFLFLLSTIAVLMVMIQVIRKYSYAEKWLSVALFIAPFGGAILFALLAKLQGQNSSVYLVRYFLFASPFLLILIALCLQKITVYGLRQIMIVGLVLVNLGSIGYYWEQLDVSTKPGMNGVALLLQKNVEPTHKVYVASSFEFFNYKYYRDIYDIPAQPLLYSGGSKVANLPHFAGTAILTDNDLVPDFSVSGMSGDTIWLIWTNGFGGSKPVVPTNWAQVDEFGFAEIRPYVGTWVVVTKYQVK